MRFYMAKREREDEERLTLTSSPPEKREGKKRGSRPESFACSSSLFGASAEKVGVHELLGKKKKGKPTVPNDVRNAEKRKNFKGKLPHHIS